MFAPTSRQATIRAYLYTQYQDDDDLWAFFDSFNSIAQDQLDFLNNLNLPVYTHDIISGRLLDWVGEGLYGIPRPTVVLGLSTYVGPLNTWELNTTLLNSSRRTKVPPYIVVSDDYYKRVLTWHHYRGDGKQFTIPWLRRRVARFLYGPNGADIVVDKVSLVSVTVSSTKFFLGSPSADRMSLAMLTALVQSARLELPFQYSYEVGANNAPLSSFILDRNTLAP